MKSKFLQVRKMLLVAAALLVGGVSSAWAEEITNLKLIFNGTTSSSTYVLGDGEIAETNLTGGAWNTSDKDGYGLQVDTENQRLILANANTTATLVSYDKIKEKDIVVIAFDIALGYSTKGTDKDFTFKALNTNGEAIITEVFNARTASRRSSTIGFTADDVYYPSNTATSWENKTHFEIVLNYATGEITGTTTSSTATNKTTTKTVPMNDAQKVAIKSLFFESGDMGTIKNTNLLANLTVTTTVGDYSSTKTITYKYQDEDGQDITEIALAAGATLSATPDNGTEYTPVYLSEFTDNDYAYDYKYVSGGESFTVTEDKEITLIYSKTAHPTTEVKVRYTYNGDVLKETIAENHPVGKELTYWVNKYVLEDGTLYQTQQQTNYYQRTVNVTDGLLTEALTKTDINNIVFFIEGEDIEGASAGSTPTRASNGKEGHTGGSENYLEVTTLGAGKYKIYTLGHNGNKDTRNGNFKVEDNVVFTFEISNNTNVSNNSDEFEVLTLSTLYFSCEGSNASGVDYLYIQRTGDATVSATIGATGYTTFTSTAALDLSELTEQGVTAYYASEVKDGYIVLKEVTGTVAAGEGLILKGEGQVTIPVAISGEAIDGNLLKGCTAETTLTENANQYVLANNNGTAEFQSLADNGATIPAGKAYLEVPAAAARTLSIVFGGETTGIAEVATAGVENGAVYNLSGQRVSKPANGLYIVNGKKIVLK